MLRTVENAQQFQINSKGAMNKSIVCIVCYFVILSGLPTASAITTKDADSNISFQSWNLSKEGNNHRYLSNLWQDIMLKEIPEEGHRLARRTQETLIEKTRARAQDRVPANKFERRWEAKCNEVLLQIPIDICPCELSTKLSFKYALFYARSHHHNENKVLVTCSRCL